MPSELEHDWKAEPVRKRARPMHDLLREVVATGERVKGNGAANDRA